MRAWLRRNLAALIVIVIALPALAYVFVGLPLLDNASRGGIAWVKQGDTIETGGYEFTLTASQEFIGTGTGPGTNNIPLGSSIVGALVTATPTKKQVDSYCDTELTSREGGTERTWSIVSSPSDFDYGVGEERTTSCILDGEAFELETVFLTPTGAYDHATVDVTVGSESFRFALVH